jgi:hypothetical protein
MSLTTVLLELPVSVVQGAHLSSLKPTGDAVKMEGVVADSPGYSALFGRGGCLVGLTFDAEIHDMVTADSAVVDDNVPGPEGNSVPLLDFETRLVTFIPALTSGLLWLSFSLGRR